MKTKYRKTQKVDKKQLDDYNSFEDMVKAHRSVLKSLIEKDGWFKTNEAVEINNGFGKQLTVLKMRMEAFKLMKETPERGELFLSEKENNKQKGD
jgi:hypothetical protein|tara:strand:+ start:1063 stop:1347 length:285 start_codon:yes stop_codon:yes gene_type:complete